MADAIPWEIFEKKYSRLFKGKNGRVAKPLRLALGSLIIQTKYQYSDRELVDQLTENPYYQYFIGLPGYQEEPPIDASTLVLFRKRLKMDVIMEANEYMLEAFKEKESKDKNDDDHTNPPSGGGDGESNKEPEQAPENKGTLMLDATCAPSNIRYPQDFSLLNEARENWKLSSSVSVKVMDFQDHVCIAGKPERTTLHLRKQRNAALRKSEQPFVNS